MPVQAWVWWQQLGLVMAGGALGAAARFWLGGVLMRQLGSGFPWGTFAVNMIGSFAAGFLAIWLEGRGPSALYWRAFLLVGVLGADDGERLRAVGPGPHPVHRAEADVGVGQIGADHAVERDGPGVLDAQHAAAARGDRIAGIE